MLELDQPQPLYSSLAADPDWCELVLLFVGEMPHRAQALLDQAASGDWAEVARMAHQFKGTAGSYGFDQLTPYAIELEAAAREAADEERIRLAVEELVGLCRLCRAGTPH
ncbi:MAG: Hpt domain-containing protein [Thermoguttaceae bacterium]|jgi:HPt (histidine-containing phosphotransfer) domain-containing protein